MYLKCYLKIIITIRSASERHSLCIPIMASESPKESVTTAYVPKIKSYPQCYNRPVCQSMGTFCNCSIKEKL